MEIKVHLDDTKSRLLCDKALKFDPFRLRSTLSADGGVKHHAETQLKLGKR
jgi:hypothetical protein